MPAFDQTGPQGEGPMTGRGWGPCDDVPQNLCEQEGLCSCPTCGYTKEHDPYIPCQNQICPTCNIGLVRIASNAIVANLKKLANDLRSSK